MLPLHKLASMVGLLTFLGIAWWMAAGVVAQETEAAPPEEPAAVAPDPYVLPEGGPDELVRFIQRILRTRPANEESREKAVAAVKEAADKILAGEADAVATQTAVQVKSMFADSAEELAALAEALGKAGKNELARQVRGAVLGRRLREASQADGDEVAEKVRAIIKQVEQYLAEGPLQRSDAGLAIGAGRILETLGDTDLAAATYTSFSKLFLASDDKDVASFGETLEGVVRRLNLVGNDMKVEGTVLGGKALDWPQYRGKVVLVDFWATWCGPCIRELPNMMQTYEAYRDRGFEIVGISLDRDRQQLEKFVQDRKIPWTIVHDDGEPNPTAGYYGVMAIPTMILVGADGKVVSTKARGEQLRAELEKLLGPAEKKSPEEEPATTE